MFSIIICSISPEKLKSVTQNIQSTIGMEYEIISIDNREKGWPIARAYNEGAQRARYPYLFFVHEDVKFHSIGWGETIKEKLNEPDCGVIGFAGTKVMLRCYSGWLQDYRWMCLMLYQGLKNNQAEFWTHNVFLEHPFEEVVALDGLGMFVRKEVWSAYPFDEEVLTGFHCYDVDFTLQIAATKQYKNYVCCSTKVLIEHFSEGNLNHSWYRDTIRIHKQKWSKILPVAVEGFEFGSKELEKQTERCFNSFVRLMLKSDYPEKWLVVKEFLAYPFSWKHFGHCASNVFRYLKLLFVAP